MPSLEDDPITLENKSISKIDEQLNFLKYQRPSGM